jgi:phosphohistidine phosphatase
MMRLFFLRHGAAVPGSSRLPDFERPLTEDGRTEVAAVAHGLLRLKLSGVPMLSSPLVRARETSEIVAPILNTTVEIVDDLRSGAPFAVFQQLINRSLGRDCLLLVGHEPDFSDAIGALIGADGEALVLKKAGAVRIDISGRAERGAGRLRWLLTPTQLVLMGGTTPPTEKDDV